MTLPFVGVVVPVYNGAATLGACLESLLAQDYPRELFEVVVAENGSTDDTAEVAARYPVRLLRLPAAGAAAARNRADAESRADVIACTDADCVATPGWLRALAAALDDPAVGGAGGPVLALHHPERTDVERFCADNPPLVNFDSGPGEFLPHLFTANAAYRRPLLERIGGFDERMITAYDVELSWRLQLETGARLGWAPDAVVHHHHRSTWAGLARQYRQYGFGEVLLDTMYGHRPGYPRDRARQRRRILEQLLVLPRYVASIGVRGVRLALGSATPYDVKVPLLRLLIESANLRGKLDGLIATRLMTDASAGLRAMDEGFMRRLVPHRKE